MREALLEEVKVEYYTSNGELADAILKVFKECFSKNYQKRGETIAKDIRDHWQGNILSLYRKHGTIFGKTYLDTTADELSIIECTIREGEIATISYLNRSGME